MSGPSPASRLGSSLAYPGLLLGMAVLLATTLLALVQLATAPSIAQRQAEDLIASLSEVIPARLHSNNLLTSKARITSDNRSVDVYQALSDTRVTAVAFSRVTRDGYAGPITLLLGVNAAGELLGVRVLSHSETPGLGDRMELGKSDWILGFNGLSLASTPAPLWAVKKDGGRFDQFTGATVTPRALVSAVRDGLLFFQQHRERLLTPAVQPPEQPSSPLSVGQQKTGDR